jgi:hypothetical protein
MANLGVSDVHYFSQTGEVVSVLANALSEQGSWAVSFAGNELIAYSTDPSSFGYVFRMGVHNANNFYVKGFDTLDDAEANINEFWFRYVYFPPGSSALTTRVFCDSRLFFLFCGADFFTTCVFGDLTPYLDTDTTFTVLNGNAGINTSTIIYAGNNANEYPLRAARAIDQVTRPGLVALRANRVTGNHAFGDSGEVGFPSASTGHRYFYPIEAMESPTRSRGRFTGVYAPGHYIAGNPATALRLADGTLVDAFGIPGRKLMVQKIINTYGCFGIDVTGPWRDDGNLSIEGIITEKAVPGAYRVNLYRQSDMQLLKTAWSGVNGAYSFTKLANQKYVVVATDHTNPLRTAAIKSHVIPS